MRPSVQGVTPGELLRLAASVDQVSAHVLGDALAEAAAGAGLRLTLPSQVHELPGQGIGGVVGDRPVAVGSPTFLRSVGVPGDEIAAALTLGGRGSGEARVLVAVDGHMAGVIVMADEVRPEAARGGGAVACRWDRAHRDGLRRSPVRCCRRASTSR